MVQLPDGHPQTVRPIDRSPRAQYPDAKRRGSRDNAIRLRHVEPTRVPLRHAPPSPPPQVLDSLYRLAKAQSRRPTDFLSGHAFVLIKLSHKLMSKSSPWSQGRQIPFGMKERTTYSPYQEKAEMVQKILGKKRHLQINKKEKIKKHVWLLGRLHIE